jgi:hypothetical protein
MSPIGTIKTETTPVTVASKAAMKREQHFALALIFILGMATLTVALSTTIATAGSRDLPLLPLF